MKYPTVFHLISTVVDKADVHCVLIGGFAVNYYKVTRQTADVDFLITENDFKKILEAIYSHLNYTQLNIILNFVRIKTYQILLT